MLEQRGSFPRKLCKTEPEIRIQFDNKKTNPIDIHEIIHLIHTLPIVDCVNGVMCRIYKLADTGFN